MEDRERSNEYKAFLKHVSESTGVCSYETAAVLWPAFCQSALDWIVLQRKSVDMGFVILHPCPLRGNWKQAMIALFPSLGPSLVGKSKVHREHLLQETGFNVKMQHAEMLSVMEEKYIGWGIETELKKSWWKAMMTNERHIYQQLGSVKYARYVARKIVELRTKLTKCYMSFLRQVSYPCGRIYTGRKFGGGFIIPFVPKGKIRPVADKDIPVSLMVNRNPENVPSPRLQDVVGKENEAVPKMPNIQSGEQDLRVVLGDTNPGGKP